MPIAAVLRRDPHRRWSHTEGIPPKSEPPAGVLVRRAVFDTSAEVRQRATEALRLLPPRDYLPALLGALRYPWPPAR